MKKITLPLVLLALCFATGFTCSKNAPQQAAALTETAPAESMAAAPVAPPSTETAEAAQPATTTAQPTTATETK